ncbi:MAG: glycosyltransferase family 4 protein, partial [Pseudomonadota bacterium]
SYSPAGISQVRAAMSTIRPKRWPSNITALEGVLPEDLHTGGSFRRIGSIVRWLKARHPDVLITNNWGAMEWAAAANFVGKMGRIHTESGFGPDEAFKLNPKRGLFRRAALRRHDAVLLCSQTLVTIARESWKLSPSVATFVPDGIDIARFSPDGITPMDLQVPTDAVVIGCVAPLRAEKNLTALLNAFDLAWQADPSLHLAIAGDGPEADALKAHTAGLQSRAAIQFVGFVDHIETFLKAIDICALSSDTEQLPNAILQAMAMALPVAAFAVGDIAHMTAELNAPYLPARRDIEGLSKAFLALAEYEESRQRIGNANQEKCAEHYTQALMAERYKAAIERAAS